jgi:hypothetical protein
MEIIKGYCAVGPLHTVGFGLAQSRWGGQLGFEAHLLSRGAAANARRAGTGGGPTTPAALVARGGGSRARAWRHDGELALGIGDGRGSPGGLAHNGGESVERNRLGCRRPVAKGPSGSAGERWGVGGSTEGAVSMAQH